MAFVTEFDSLKLKEIEFVLRYRTQMKHWTARNRTTHIIGIQLSGSAVHYFDRKKFTISGGCIYFLNQKDDYTVKVLESPDAISIHFTTFAPIDTESFCIPLNDPTETVTVFERFARNHQNIHRNPLKITAEFYAICAKFYEISQMAYLGNRKDILLAKEYIDCNFREKDCLTHAAAMCNITRRRFNDVFKSAFGETPNRYLTMKKMEYAVKLLEAESMPISEIALRCGCSDVYYFCKVFKSVYAATPGKYRSMIQNKNENSDFER